MPKTKAKILVALSGGVDSSVTAALLVKQKHKVTAAFMINYDQSDGDCWKKDYQDALRVCAKLGIQLLKLDFTKKYKQNVLEYMYSSYKKGNTPNPDVLCNKYIKFGAWLNKAKELGFSKLATGHYASVKKDKDEYILEKSVDKNKDQTYFLHQLDQEQLSKTLFPLGKYKKDEVRDLAKKFNLPTANKQESMGICFIGEVPMKQFLQKEIEPNPGEIILSKTSKILGQHDGLAFYTIGQRHLNVKEANKPLFVLKKDIKNNQLIVGYEDNPLLYSKEIEINKPHWISRQKINFPLKCEVRLRHRQELQGCSLVRSKSKIIVNFYKKQKAVTPGQFAVFYKNNVCLGGGEISL